MIRPTFTPSARRGLVAPVPRGADELRALTARLYRARDPGRAAMVARNLRDAFLPAADGDAFAARAADYLDGLADALDDARPATTINRAGA